MRHTLPGFIGAAMIILAGCSSKSAVSTSGDSSGTESGAGADGATSGITVESLSGDGAVAGMVIGDIFFDFDSSALSDEAQEQLKKNAAWMEKNPLVNVTIQGHCDERGTDEYNLALGERRATAAKEYLITAGVNAGRLTAVSFGEEMPFDPGHNEEAWAKNRRDHFMTK